MTSRQFAVLLIVVAPLVVLFARHATRVPTLSLVPSDLDPTLRVGETSFGDDREHVVAGPGFVGFAPGEEPADTWVRFELALRAAMGDCGDTSAECRIVPSNPDIVGMLPAGVVHVPSEEIRFATRIYGVAHRYGGCEGHGVRTATSAPYCAWLMPGGQYGALNGIEEEGPDAMYGSPGWRAPLTQPETWTELAGRHGWTVCTLDFARFEYWLYLVPHVLGDEAVEWRREG